MTEHSFITVYLMGMYHEQQIEGNALRDVDFQHYEPSKTKIQQAKEQYRKYLSNQTLYNAVARQDRKKIVK